MCLFRIFVKVQYTSILKPSLTTSLQCEYDISFLMVYFYLYHSKSIFMTHKNLEEYCYYY